MLTNETRQNAFRHRLKQIPVKIMSHHKSSSDSALFQRPDCSNTKLRHKGVSFEILNPPKSPRFPVSSKPLALQKGLPAPAPFFDPMSSQFFNQGTPAREIRREQQTTLEYGSQSGTEREECRPISPRALFEDLPTAHSSITSRITNQRNNLFLMSPHTDHSINDLNMEVPLDMTADRSPVTRPPNCSGLLTSYFGEGFTSDLVVSNECNPVLTSVENKAIDRPFQEIESTSIPLQDGIEDPRTTLADLVVRGASIGQLSSYFSGKPSRSSCQPQGEVTKRYTSKLIKPRPSGVKHFFQWKKLRASGASSLLSNLTTRQLNPQTAHSRVKKRSSSEDGRKRRGSKASIKTITNYRRSVSSPLERLSADIEALVEENIVSVAACPQPGPFESRPESQLVRPRSISVYSENDEPPPELHNQALANGVRTNNSYLVDPQLSTHLSCEERRHGYQGNPISSLNFSKPIHPLASHPTGVNTGMSPIPYSPGCSNLRPSLDSHRANNILERLHGISSQTSPRHGSDPTLIMCGDPGTIQSSSISGIAENDFPGDEYEDMGPGSSQTTSSPRLSGLGTFSSLRSRLKLPSTLSSRSKGSGLRTNICNMKSLSKENEGLADQMEFGSALESNTKLEGSMWNEEEDAQTWQTVAESQQFRSDMRSDFSKVDTGSSLANFSSYGSLANAETQPWSSLQLLGKHQDFPSYPSNPVTAHPGQRDPAHPHRLHQRPTTGNDILPPVYQYVGKPVGNVNHLSNPMPVLKASTEVCPAPLIVSTSQYQHPTPLSGPHVHPFKTPPPVLDKWKSRLRKQSIYQASRFGPDPVNPSCKSDFFDFSCHQQPQYRHLHEHEQTPLDAQCHQNSVIERLGPSATASSDWCTVSSFQDMSMSVLNEDSSSRVRIQHKHNPFSSTKHNTTNNPTSILSHPFKYFNSHPKRPFSHKYPRMSMFATENLPANECNSQHSLPLTAAIRSSPRDYFASDGRKQGDVLQMPERAHLAAFSSTDQLILDPLLNSSPPRLRDRSSGDGITPTTCNGTGSSHKSQSLISETRLQHGQRPAIPKLRWPLTHGNDNETAKSRVKSPSREDLVRERIRQLNDPILATTSRQNRRDPPPRPVSERSTIPHRSHTVTSRLVNINEELETGQWYCSENGRYAFSTPPRLFRMSTKSRQRDNVVASTSTTGFALQRRVGREVIIGSTIMLPLGWLLLAYIAMVGQRANWLINWRSRGEVAQFHEKDIRFARQVFGGVFLVLIIIGFVTATGVLASRDSK